ncbi:MAG TPA: hypothetical protein DCE42_08225 [Myxococcales bacterium]|nr:hypothetical protein [Deltaproteobacteria bacterium]HAA54731.1 hypothetical protein [Myxococcales bacterium]
MSYFIPFKPRTSVSGGGIDSIGQVAFYMRLPVAASDGSGGERFSIYMTTSVHSTKRGKKGQDSALVRMIAVVNV